MKTTFLILVLFSLCAAQHLSEIEYYEQLIDEHQKKAEEYVFKTDAREFYCDLNSVKDFGSYDFVIVGAGATGTVVANRLSGAGYTVLLLEAGNFTNDFVQIPSMETYYELSDFNWQYVSIPQKSACLGMKDARCTYPRGKGLGGTTLINSLVYSRGNPRDYDTLEELGNPGWAFRDVLPYFKRSESYHQTNPNAVVYWSYHSQDGELYTEYPLPETFIGKIFIEACQQYGYNSTDLNSPWQTGCSFPPFNIKHGRRVDGGTAFITGILNRPNLKVQTNSYAVKINMEGHTKSAEGITFCHQGLAYFAVAKKEVIISAGAIESPHLLLLSGIGPKEHLEEHDIPLVQDLQVGSTLRDHTKYYGLIYSTNYTEIPKPREEYIREYLDGIGPFSLAGVGGILFAQTKVETTPNYPDIEVLIVPPNATSTLAKKVVGWTDQSWNALWEGKDVTKHFAVMTSHLHTISTGSVRLNSSDPFEYPLVDSGFLSDEGDRDIESLYQGIQIVVGMINNTRSFQEIDAQLTVKYLPACSDYAYPSKEWWYCAIRHLSSNNYHPFGSCRMGPDPENGDVVNYELKVHGVERLRVADASIFTHFLTGHTNAPCVMVGEKVSHMIIREHM